MSLKDYHKKRNFKKTTEPKGKIGHGRNHHFVVQKHAASHLHYDFRLELNGVLLSWAVPKGPCIEAKVKRLAMHVEDHPLEYGSFEGIIPQGEYGGGTVMVWDQGIWKALDKNPSQAYKEGHLRFELLGEKLLGRWDLFRFKDDKHWFLVKHADQYAKKDYDITLKKPLSVISKLSIEAIKDQYQNVWTKKGCVKAPKIKIHLPKHLKKQAYPKLLSPQLATLVDKAPEGQDWLHEVKFDGYRIVAFIKDKKVILKSRNHKDWTHELQSVAEGLKPLAKKNMILDGEVVLLDKKGKSDFQLLQNAIKSATAHFVYYIFDIVFYDHFDLKTLPLIERKNILHSILPENDATIRYSDHIIDQGNKVFHQACELALEGIISKNIHSPYESRRDKSWLKVKCIKRQEFVIGGYTQPRGARNHFGALLLGVFNKKGEFEYAGNVGTGFTQASLKDIYTKMQKVLTKKNPFLHTPKATAQAHWLKPVLVAEVEFTEWTKEKHLRHPSFKGLRSDKAAKKIQREITMPLKQPAASLVLTHPDKIMYPEDQFTKQDLLNYYESISDYILPFLKNRPLSLVRCPENYKKCFYQRHYNATTPKALKSIEIEGKEGIKPYIYLDDQAGLLGLVQMGVLEIHPWGSLITSLETPDFIVIDLDPAPDVLWKTVVTAAFEIKEQLAELKLKSFVKTTGGKGLHIVVPIQPEHEWLAIKNFTHQFVEYLEKLNPKRYISKMTKSKRKGKIFVDYMRNQYGATAVSAYSTRSHIHAPVSVPLEWDELTHSQKDTAFTIKTLPKRLAVLKKIPWKEFWKLKQQLRL